VKIEGSLYVGGDARSPAVVVAHRLAGTRAEWVPLVERIFPPKSPFNVLAIDLRGHGGSVGTGKGAKGNKKQLGWNELAPGDFAAMSKDVQAAIQWMDRRSGGPASSVVLMGSDIGSTAVTVASKGLGVRLRGLALVSPGAALRGVDLYKPFGEVLLLPNLIVAATMDNTSAEPAQALQAMSKSSRLVRLDGSLHSAEYLGRDRPMVWDELADWLEERVTASASPPAVPSASTSK
jgi:pimeloyl-ACP methyl ester carboxylesterase